MGARASAAVPELPSPPRASPRQKGPEASGAPKEWESSSTEKEKEKAKGEVRQKRAPPKESLPSTRGSGGLGIPTGVIPNRTLRTSPERIREKPEMKEIEERRAKAKAKSSGARPPEEKEESDSISVGTPATRAEPPLLPPGTVIVQEASEETAQVAPEVSSASKEGSQRVASWAGATEGPAPAGGCSLLAPRLRVLRGPKAKAKPKAGGRRLRRPASSQLPLEEKDPAAWIELSEVKNKDLKIGQTILAKRFGMAGRRAYYTASSRRTQRTWKGNGSE